MARQIPRGLFVEGGGQGNRPAVSAHPIVPLEWLISHPSTFPWISKGVRSGVGAGFVVDTALQLDSGYEGIITFLKVIGNSSGWQADNSGIQFALVVNKVNIFRSRQIIAAATVNEGFFDDLGADNGYGETWGDVRVWLEEGALVQFTYQNNGGPTNTLGMMCRGYAWPTTIRREWLARGWRK